MSRRIRFTLAYDGTDFHGWQVQPGLSTVQGILEGIMAGIEGRYVHVAGSGRTDAGVHALAQVAAVTLSNPIPPENLQKAVNRLLPPSIRMLDVWETGTHFHPRFDAVAKTYRYTLFRGPVCPPHEWRYVHSFPYPLDEERMFRLAPLLEGEHDFTAFAASNNRQREMPDKVRTVFSSRLERLEDRLIYRVRGSGFLKHMVRNMVGTLIEGGRGNLDERGVAALLESKISGQAGPTAPPKGLFLESVEYGPHDNLSP